MDILPDKKKFIQLAASSCRIPVFGEEKILNLDPFLLFQELYKYAGQSFLFESGKGPKETSQYSIFGNSTSRLLKFFGSQASLYKEGILEKKFSNVNEAFKLLNFEINTRQISYLPHFWGGWVGFIGYEAVTLFENISLKTDQKLPDLSFMEVERMFIYDHSSNKLKFILSGLNKTKESDYEEFIVEIEQVWIKVKKALKNFNVGSTYSDLKRNSFISTTPKSLLNKGEYIKKVNRTKTYIAEGDIYQANISQKFETPFNQDPLILYMRLRKINPSPFSGFLKFDDLVLVSSSPERLIKISGNNIESRPIAGTRPRSNIIEKDHALMAELLLNEKERAEHLMLVDLERNDLGRLCKPGSVKVTDFMFLEKYSHVTHIVSNISGNLLPDQEIFKIFKAIFPGGTITGCPKIRCMEIINELEPVTRGPYSGSFGYIGFAPYMDLNIIIRSIIIHDHTASFHVGAGIVADSVPEKEYLETLDKAAPMIEALSMNE